MKTPSNLKTARRIYGYFLEDGSLQYIGSSTCSLKSLEYNHRNAHTKWPNEEHNKFRNALLNSIKQGYFKTLIEIQCDLPTIEHIEGELIRSFRPPYNIDLDPVKSSKRNKRYTL